MSLPLLATSLSWPQTAAVLAVLLLSVLGVGYLVYRGRKATRDADPSPSLIRSWIAVTLVIGLLVFGLLSFLLDDTSVRSTLIGGLTASAGAAIAYYFSSKASEGARRDIIDAALGTEEVPDLETRALPEAQAILAKTSLRLQLDPDGSKVAGASVATGDHSPSPNSIVRRGSVIRVKFTERERGPAPPP